jgi:hypothetical protein
MIEWQKILNGIVTFPKSLTVEDHLEDREYWGVKIMSTVSLDTTKENNGAIYKCLLVYNGKQTINLEHQVIMDIRCKFPQLYATGVSETSACIVFHTQFNSSSLDRWTKTGQLQICNPVPLKG